MVAHLSLLPSAWQQWSGMLSFRMAAPCAMTAEHKHVLDLAPNVSLAFPSSTCSCLTVWVVTTLAIHSLQWLEQAWTAAPKYTFIYSIST